MYSLSYYQFREALLDRLTADPDLSFRMPVIDLSERVGDVNLALTVSTITDLLPDREADLGRPVLVTLTALGRQKRSYDPAYIMQAIERVLHARSFSVESHEILGFRLVGSTIGHRHYAAPTRLKTHFSMSYYATLYPKKNKPSELTHKSARFGLYEPMERQSV